MKRTLIALFLAVCLIVVMAAPVFALDTTKTASVTVNAFKSVTISDPDPEGLSFGSLNPGADKVAEADAPSITITAAAENNGDVVVTIKGTDFSDDGTPTPITFPVTNAFWKTSNDPVTAIAMTTTDATVATLGAGDSVSIYHWLSVPDEQTAATYESTFTYSTN